MNLLPNQLIAHFLVGEYKTHLRNVVFEREMSKMPDTMPLAEKQQQIDIIATKRTGWFDAKQELLLKIKEIDLEINKCTSYIHRITLTKPGQKAEKKEYDVKCPNPTECRGIMSRNKCGLCNIKTC